MPATALITGAAKRLGAVISHYLAQQGYHLFLHYRTSFTEAQQLKNDLKKKYPKQQFVLIQQDLSATSFEPFIQAVQEHSLDLLIHNASLFLPTPLEKLTVSEWDQILQVNTRTPVFLTQALLPPLRKSSRPCVIFISDIHGETAFPLKYYSAYGASKAALLYLTKQMALELAPHIRVNAICPGITLWPESLPEKKKERLLQAIPLKKINDPQEIAQAVVFLANQLSMTGVSLPVDGGRFLARADIRQEDLI